MLHSFLLLEKKIMAVPQETAQLKMASAVLLPLRELLEIPDCLAVACCDIFVCRKKFIWHNHYCPLWHLLCVIYMWPVCLNTISTYNSFKSNLIHKYENILFSLAYNSNQCNIEKNRQSMLVSCLCWIVFHTEFTWSWCHFCFRQ